MREFGWLALLAAVGGGVGALWTFALGLAGAPGAVLGAAGARGHKRRWLSAPGLILCVIGQTYAALAFAVAVQGVRADLFGASRGLLGVLSWLAAFGVAQVPVTSAIRDAANEPQRNTQHFAIVVTFYLALVGFFVLARWPSLAGTWWRWVPWAHR